MKRSNELITEEIRSNMIRLLKSTKLNRDFDIPYLAGYSLDGETIYIDKDFPRELGYDKYIMIHEIAEDILEYNDIKYQEAHKLATEIEHYFCNAEGIDVKEYERTVSKYIKIILNKDLKICPKDLDLQPYEDENDLVTLKKIKVVQ